MPEYTIILDPDDKGRGYGVTIPSMPGCITQGKTKAEAIERAKEGIEVYLESFWAEGKPMPRETRPTEMVKVVV